MINGDKPFDGVDINGNPVKFSFHQDQWCAIVCTSCGKTIAGGSVKHIPPHYKNSDEKCVWCKGGPLEIIYQNVSQSD